MKNKPAHQPLPYERSIYQFLSIYRFFAFAIAIVLIQVVPLRAESLPTTQTYIILTLLGIYTILKMFSPFRLWQKDIATYLVLGGDLVICISLTLFTGGLDSGLLLYSLIPIITAALLFEEKIALSLASLSSLSLLVAHLGLCQLTDKFAWVLHDNYLITLLIIYILFCFLIATLAFRTNLNIRRRIEKDAVLEERRRIGREIHDGVAQSLGYLNLKTKMLSNSVSSGDIERTLGELDDIRKAVGDAYEDVRESIDLLTIEPTQGFPLVPTLAQYIGEFGERTGIRAEFAPPQTPLWLSPPAELQLLRIAQEALTNVRKHSQASEVEVRLENTSQGLEMVVKDNGRGFSTSDSELRHYGLSIMRERAESLGGILAIISAPGQGTQVKVSLPWTRMRL